MSSNGYIALGWITRRDGRDWDGSLDLFELASDFQIGNRIERHRRTWIAGPSTSDRSSFWGRIGFQSDDGANEIWDEEKKDFTTIAARTGSSSPFLVRARDGRLAFQLRPGVIRRTGYCGALEALLNEARDESAWRVSADLAPLEWSEWIGQAGRIKKLTFVIKEPNPNWRGRESLEGIVEGANAHTVRMVYEAHDQGAGIDVTDDVVMQAIQHTVERGYGKVIGESDGGSHRRFDSSRGEAPPEYKVPLPNKGSKDVSAGQLEEAIEESD